MLISPSQLKDDDKERAAEILKKEKSQKTGMYDPEFQKLYENSSDIPSTSKANLEEIPSRRIRFSFGELLLHRVVVSSLHGWEKIFVPNYR